MQKEKFLADAPLESGTGAAMAWAVFRVLEEWGIDERIIAFSTDSTSSNTGIDNGKQVLNNNMVKTYFITYYIRTSALFFTRFWNKKMNSVSK